MVTAYFSSAQLLLFVFGILGCCFVVYVHNVHCPLGLYIHTRSKPRSNPTSDNFHTEFMNFPYSSCGKYGMWNQCLFTVGPSLATSSQLDKTFGQRPLLIVQQICDKGSVSDKSTTFYTLIVHYIPKHISYGPDLNLVFLEMAAIF